MTGATILAVILIVSVDAAHDVTVKTNDVSATRVPAALVIEPVTVVVYTPAAVGSDHVIVSI